MGWCRKPCLFVLDFPWCVKIETKVNTCIISLECGGILETQSPNPIKCSITQGLSLYFSTRNFLGFSRSGDLKPKRASPSLWLWPFEEDGHRRDRDMGKTNETHALFPHWRHTNMLIVILCALVFCCWTFLFLAYYASTPPLLDASAQTSLLSFISLTVTLRTPLVLLRITSAPWRCLNSFEGKSPKLQCMGERVHTSL